VFLCLESVWCGVHSSSVVAAQTPNTFTSFLEVGFIPDGKVRALFFCPFALVFLKLVLTANSVVCLRYFPTVVEAVKSHDTRLIGLLDKLVSMAWNLTLACIFTTIISFICYSGDPVTDGCEYVTDLLRFALFPILCLMVVGMVSSARTYLSDVKEKVTELEYLKTVDSGTVLRDTSIATAMFDGVNTQPNQVEQPKRILGMNVDEDRAKATAAPPRAVRELKPMDEQPTSHPESLQEDSRKRALVVAENALTGVLEEGLVRRLAGHSPIVPLSLGILGLWIILDANACVL